MIGDIHEAKFRGKTFKFIEGWHSASIFTFSDEQELRNNLWMIKEGDVVYDVGPAFGSYTLPALALGATVYAFEPVQWLCEALVANIEANEGFEERFELYPVALSDTEKKRLLAEEIMEHGTSLRDARHEGYNHIVPFKRMDSYPVKKLDWIKIDTEGQEFRVLRGGIETLKQHHPKLLIETHLGARGIDRFIRINGIYEGIQKLLKGLGYQITEHNYIGRLYIFAEVEEGGTKCHKE